MRKTRREKIESLMTDEKSAIELLSMAYHQLEKFGWKSPVYCPKDGRAFNIIEAGSTGIHDCYYSGDWPSGSYEIFWSGDSATSYPTMFKPKD